ncbi:MULTISPECIES: hypothetical protein [Erysipelothrix]|uniref:hypothetical protein n=1 Tax=Erysipelothrix TaxID=1647 RepID=UPI0014092F8E|nr:MULTISPECIES: hypothetical protein [Erysipelothrix]MDV7678475.1 hypothetical protein [Erysipelothrix rhusiopathiae]WMT70175.1 hypothetical protein K0H77_01295 [Erysipelothrix rhusiopathiae]
MKYYLRWTHNNGAKCYESIDGKKVFLYNGKYFKTVAQVNNYIKETGIHLNAKENSTPKQRPKGQYSIAEYKKLKGE